MQSGCRPFWPAPGFIGPCSGCAEWFSARDGCFFTGCAALTLNPLLLDFFVAARGYGLATAGLFWALYEMLSWFHDRSNGVAEQLLRKRLWKAALGCSIAVATNLTFLMPVFILAAAFCVLIVRSGEEPEPSVAKAPLTPSKGKKRAGNPKPKRRAGQRAFTVRLFTSLFP